MVSARRCSARNDAVKTVYEYIVLVALWIMKHRAKWLVVLLK